MNEMAHRERENARVVAIGYALGRLDAGEKRVDQDTAVNFGDFYVKQDDAETWQQLNAAFETFVAEQAPAVTS